MITICIVWQALDIPRQKKATNQKKKPNIERREPTPILSLDPLLYPVSSDVHADDDFAFDETMESLLPDFLQARSSFQESESKYDGEVILRR